MDEIDKVKKSLNDKKLMNQLFIALMGLIEVVIFCAMIYVAVQLIIGPREQIYNLIAVGVLLVWFGILVGYYAWAIYFYNINLGLTNQDWAEIREKKLQDPEGVKVPDVNPNAEQTLGLPMGTVRGSLALTLMVGGISMTIAGFGMNNMIEDNAFLVDNFDFFKTAFLMMIAFYFGNKSLEIMGYKSSKTIGGKKDSSGDNATPTPKAPSPPVPSVQDVSAAKDLLKQGDLTNTPADIQPSPMLNNDFELPESVG